MPAVSAGGEALESMADDIELSILSMEDIDALEHSITGMTDAIEDELPARGEAWASGIGATVPFHGHPADYVSRWSAADVGALDRAARETLWRTGGPAPISGTPALESSIASRPNFPYRIIANSDP